MRILTNARQINRACDRAAAIDWGYVMADVGNPAHPARVTKAKTSHGTLYVWCPSVGMWLLPIKVWQEG